MIFFFIENTPKTKINIWYLNSVLLVFTSGYFYGMSLPQQEYLEFRKKQNYYGILSYQNGNHKNLNGFELKRLSDLGENVKTTSYNE